MGGLFEQYEQAVCMIDETECWSARDRLATEKKKMLGKKKKK